MEKFRKIIYVSISVLTVIVAIASLLSMFRDTDSRFLKMLDFARIQFFVTSFVSMILFVIFTRKWRWYDYALVVGLIGGLIVNGFYLINYTSFVPVKVAEVGKVTSNNDEVRLLISNVKMKNRQSRPIIDLINKRKPDIFIGLEIDSWWDEQLNEVESKYKYSKEIINEVSYGMVLYSKFPLENIEVRYFQNEDVPSIETVVVLDSGKKISLFSVHPVPPTYFKEYPDNEGKQEVEMLKVGQAVKKSNFPSIVAGDFNDVVWSKTDVLMGTENLLHDVRVGRGFYNTFDANNFLMRWALDHVFVTKQFQLKKLEQLQDVESDHFPLYVELVL